MNIKTLLLLLFIMVAGLSACQKASDLTPTVLTTNINVMNAGIDTLNFYQNGSRVNNLSSIYPGGSPGYLPVTAGAQNYEFKKTGRYDVLMELPLDLTAVKLYSLFVAGESADKVFLVKDSVITDNQAYIRFVNASSMTTNLDIKIGSTFIYNNRAFKSATDFTSIATGNNTVTVYQAGSSTPLLTPSTVNLSGGSTYTVYTKGVINGIGNNAFDIQMIKNR